MNQSLVRILSTASVAVLSHCPAFADSTPSASAAPDTLAQARAYVEARQWTAAIAELKRINDPASADWNNLMGYSLRKSASPDLEAAERHYNEALRIDPRHRGALEYSGELHLMRGDLAAAEKRLAVLDKACLFGCEEYTHLKKAVERFKASGGKASTSQ
ncbi:tetratricopeptide repeat protein [Accumulibacter sp.]|uniref:tetratricopeptide repeat protein n=1 Tax=Accumulibacter sp. TaxID=2053492 RepID=UPI001A61233A|nr:tetratricopeptide repeat protein [Accumulibacter sp.]MBL8400851.1 tetratricopeptide repeat protein [Accumulibacter sp.]